MEAAAASSVGAEFGPRLHPALGFRHSQRRALPCCWRPRPPLPASLSLCGGGGARPRGAIAAASGDRRRQQLGELEAEAEAEAEAGSVLGPPRSSPREVTHLLICYPRPVPRSSSLPNSGLTHGLLVACAGEGGDGAVLRPRPPPWQGRRLPRLLQGPAHAPAFPPNHRARQRGKHYYY